MYKKSQTPSTPSHDPEDCCDDPNCCVCGVPWIVDGPVKEPFPLPDAPYPPFTRFSYAVSDRNGYDNGFDAHISVSENMEDVEVDIQHIFDGDTHEDNACGIRMSYEGAQNFIKALTLALDALDEGADA